MALSKEEIDSIADALVKRVQATHYAFWIDPETHYRDHMNLQEVISSWTSAKSIFAKAFIGLVVIGLITSTFFALIKVKFIGS